MRILICTFVCTLTLFSQQTDSQWIGYYSYNSIQKLFTSGDTVYAASDNSIFEYNQNSNVTKIYSTVNGLSGEFISSIYFNSTTNQTIIGYENGHLDIIDEDDKVASFADIANTAIFPNDTKRINHFNAVNETLYISTGFGIVEFDLDNFEFGDTFIIGSSGSRTNVLATEIIDDTIFAITSASGIRAASLNNPNLVDFSQWTTRVDGAFSGAAQFNNMLILYHNSNTISVLNENMLQNVVSTPAPIVAINTDEDKLIVSLNDRVIIYDTNYEEVSSMISSEDDTFQLNTTIGMNDKLYLGTKTLGLLKADISNPNTKIAISPEGPLHNDPFRIAAFENTLWITYGRYSGSFNPFPLQRRGISRFDQDTNQWTNIPNEAVFGVSSLGYITFNPLNKEQVFISSFQNGLVELNENIASKLYNTSNSELESILDDSEVIRVNGSAFDRSGNLWIVNSRVDNGLNRLSLDTGELFKVNLSSVVPSTTADLGYTDLVLSNTEVVFMGTFDNGVVAYDPSRSVLTKITDNLPNLSVDALAIDRNDQLWIGTRNGVRVVFNASSIFNQRNPQANQIVILDEQNTPQELLFDQFITDIEVDGNNNKWISTESSGVFYLSPDGRETIAHFTFENSPLPSNTVIDIAIDNGSGIVYFATNKGLVAYRGRAIGESENLNEITTYPNPVRPGFNGNLLIRGLTAQANVKITDIQGNLVYEEVSEGGSIEWDTTAFGRHKVASGVYLILVTAENQEETKVSKVLIVR